MVPVLQRIMKYFNCHCISLTDPNISLVTFHTVSQVDWCSVKVSWIGGSVNLEQLGIPESQQFEENHQWQWLWKVLQTVSKVLTHCCFCVTNYTFEIVFKQECSGVLYLFITVDFQLKISLKPVSTRRIFTHSRIVPQVRLVSCGHYHNFYEHNLCVT